MKSFSLKFKLVFIMTSLCVVMASATHWALSAKSSISNSYRNVGQEQLPKVQIVSKLIADFRLIRINVRTLGLTGNSEADQKKYIKLTKEAISSFLKNKESLKDYEFNEKEKAYLAEMEKGWNSFLNFGKDLLSKYENPTVDSLREGSNMVRVVCPIEAAKWMEHAKAFLAYQTEVTEKMLKANF
jgi:hypothetical protein